MRNQLAYQPRILTSAKIDTSCAYRHSREHCKIWYNNHSVEKFSNYHINQLPDATPMTHGYSKQCRPCSICRLWQAILFTTLSTATPESNQKCYDSLYNIPFAYIPREYNCKIFPLAYLGHSQKQSIKSQTSELWQANTSNLHARFQCKTPPQYFSPSRFSPILFYLTGYHAHYWLTVDHSLLRNFSRQYATSW